MKVKHLKEYIQELDDDTEVHVRLNFLNVVKITKGNIVFSGMFKPVENVPEGIKYSFKDGKRIIIKQIRLPNGLKFDVEKPI